MSARDDFHKRRAQGIGGSDVAAIFGLDPYRTALDLWLEKTGQRTPIDIGDRPDVRRGNRLEPVVRKLFEHEHGGFVRKGKFHRHPRYPFMLGHVDAMWQPTETQGVLPPEHVLEIKCPSLGMFGKLQREGLPFAWMLQIQHYLCITGRSLGVWGVYCADRDHLITFPVKADPALHETLIEHESQFWACVENLQPPAEPIREDLPDIFSVGDVVKRTDEQFVGAIEDLREARGLKKAAEQTEAEAKDVLKALVHEYGIYEGPGARFYWREMPGKKSFDKRALANSRPLDTLTTMTAVAELLVEARDYGLTWDDETIAARMERALDGCYVDLSKFETQGKPFEEFRSYFFGEEG